MSDSKYDFDLTSWSEPRAALVFLARTAEQSERYDDMVCHV
jgi:hypothetical protein